MSQVSVIISRQPVSRAAASGNKTLLPPLTQNDSGGSRGKKSKEGLR